MVEKDLRNYFKESEEPSSLVINDISNTVRAGIKLEKGMGRRVNAEVVSGMVNDIATTIYYAADFLHTPPWPNIGLTYDWEEGIPGRLNNNNRIVLANTLVDSENPGGLISFSPFYLRAIADYWMGRNTYNALEYGNGSPLKKVSAHEVYHVWQSLVFPNTMEKYTEISFSQGLRAWEKTRAERSARAFEDYFEGARNCPYSLEDLWDNQLKTYRFPDKVK